MSVCHHLQSGVRQRDVHQANICPAEDWTITVTVTPKQALEAGRRADLHKEVTKTPWSPDRTPQGGQSSCRFLILPQKSAKIAATSSSARQGRRKGDRHCPSLGNAVRQTLCLPLAVREGRPPFSPSPATSSFYPVFLILPLPLFSPSLVFPSLTHRWRKSREADGSSGPGYGTFFFFISVTLSFLKIPLFPCSCHSL